MTAPSRKQLALVVDDDVTMRLLARRALEQSGFMVDEAGDGNSGLTAFEQCPADIVLLDVMMPCLDGFDTCAALRTLDNGKHVPVLMMTGLDDSDSINRAYEVGATDFITKPIAWPVLGHRVRYLLRASGAIRDLRKSEARLASAQRIARLGHWEWHAATDEVQCSEEIIRILRSKPNRWSGLRQAFLDLVNGDDCKAVEDALDAAVNRQLPAGLDLQIAGPDGNPCSVHVQIEATADQSGNLVRVQGTLQDITERKRTEAQIRRLELYDNLTGLANRHLFREQASHAVSQVARSGETVAILSVDLDRFKRVNDTLGHAIGDLLLKEVAGRMTRSLRPTDYVTRNELTAGKHCIARQGGDEFSVLLSGLNDARDAARIARRILDVLAQPFNLHGNELVMSASVGIAVHPVDGTDTDDLLKNADAAMCYAKEQGRNGYQYYNLKMNTSASEKLSLEGSLRKALERDEFRLYYQPKVNADTRAVIGAEALIRWHHPELGVVSPAEFIPLAEETGLIVPMGEWILRQACAQNKAWHDAGHTWMQVAVNMSSLNFNQENFHAMITRVLGDSGLRARFIELEMTESLLMQDAESMVNLLRHLKTTGIKLSIDDFGTGYSSLSYLKRFPIDALKIDRSFVNDITRDANDAAITSAIIAMARSLKLEVIAEGVETEDQAALLRQQGCRYMQGYLFGRPMPNTEFTMLLEESDARGLPKLAESA